MSTSQWSYLVMVFGLVVTSYATENPHGNGEYHLGDEPCDVSENGAVAPPIGNVLPGLISSDGVRHSNEAICRELCKKGEGGNACLCDWPPMKRRAVISLKGSPMARFFAYAKYPTVKDELACRILCSNGDDGHFCSCH